MLRFIIQLTVWKFVSLYCLQRNSTITHIKVQRFETFLYFVIYMEKVRKVLRIRRRSYSLSRNSRCLYRSGDARGAYRSTLEYEFKVAHLAFQRLRRTLVYDLPLHSQYSYIEYANDKCEGCRIFQSDPKHPGCLSRCIGVRKKIACIIQLVMLLF